MTRHRPKTSVLGGLHIDAAALLREPSLVLEALGQGVCVCDADGRLVWGNRVFRAYPPGLQRRVGEVCSRAVAGFGAPGGGATRSYRLARRRSSRYFEVEVALLGTEEEGSAGVSGAGQAGGVAARQVVALVRDITPQERLRRKVVAIERAGGELVHLDAETIKKMHVSERLKLLETKVIQFAHELLNFDHFAIRLLNQETRQLELVISAGLPTKACEIKLYAEPEGHGISGLVASTGKAYICGDASRDPRYVFGLDQPGSSLTVPLKLFDRVIGVFNVESNTPGAFGETDRQFAEIFGHSIAMALHILNLLLVERYTTNVRATGTVAGELSEPLNDLAAEAEALKDQTAGPEMARHVARILKDVESIQRRIRNVARGPQTLLGVEEAIERSDIDPVLEGKRILVSENEPVVSGTIRDVLAKRGCAVTVCDEGASAIKLLMQWQLTHDADQGFDLVISDINMGDKTGYDVFAAAKSAKPGLPVILMTGFGYDPHHSIVRASQEGLQCVLFKPFQVERLVDEVKKAISERAGAEGLRGTAAG